MHNQNSPPETPPPRRRGRPPLLEAGLVEQRILDAATALFLEQGFGRTTLDQVSQISKAGKSTLYGRYPDKQALFAAVTNRSIQTMFSEVKAPPAGGSTSDRLRHVGLELAKSLLVPRCISLMRITAAEAINFPDLATMAYQVSFEGSMRCVLAAMKKRTAKPSKRDLDIARRFVELVFQPVSFQAAYGAPIEALRQRCALDVEDALLLLRTKGWLDD
ncbi:TetR/AcrR family transcriptional regulator [Variovorax sp. RHLX14]|uniref:TetR/AcrR family transcriptional regulator n=1 Tax=Variovorax sp. RHLX14 TaxID=1259731 RepID=UPI003F467414